MDDSCEDEDCVDDAEWTLSYKDKDGKGHAHNLCGEHLKSFVERLKANPSEAKEVNIVPYESDEDEDEDDDDASEEE